MRLALLVLSVALWPGLAKGQAAWNVLPAESEVSYSGTSVLHGWTGTSREASGRLRLDLARPERSLFTVSAPVASFSSGNGARDRKMREVTQSSRHPLVTFTARSVRPLRWEGAPGARRGVWRVSGTLLFGGVAQAVEMDVEVREEGGRFVAEGAFPVSLTAHGVERPRLGPVPIGDTIRLRFALRAEAGA